MAWEEAHDIEYLARWLLLLLRMATPVQTERTELWKRVHAAAQQLLTTHAAHCPGSLSASPRRRRRRHVGGLCPWYSLPAGGVTSLIVEVRPAALAVFRDAEPPLFR